MTQKNSLVTSLTYLGAIPFLVAALCSLLGVNELPYLGATQPLLFSYATLIASFMAGTCCGLIDLYTPVKSLSLNWCVRIH